MNKKVEAMIDEDPKRVFSIEAEPADLFCVLNSLMKQGKTVSIRHYDSELDDFTCWQLLGKLRYPTVTG